MDFIDHKIDKGVDILHSQLSAKNIWDSEGTPRDLNYFLALGKFFTNVLHDVFTVFSDAFSGGKLESTFFKVDKSYFYKIFN